MNVYLTKVRSGIALRVFAMRIRAAGALVCALAVLGAAASASAKPRAVIAFLPAAESAKPLLDEFASRGMAIGMTSPTVGGFRVRQMPLDMGQGTRIPTRLYSKRMGALVPRGGRLVDWGVALRRADKAPGDLKPGLLASTIEQAGARVGYAGPGLAPPILAADRAGRVKRARPGDALDVIGLRSLDELDRLLAREQFVYVVEAPAGTKLRLLASGLQAPGVEGQMHSATTRRNGLIAATDVAPTVLDYLGIPIPDDMQGEVIDGRGSADAKAVAATTDRLELVTSRRAPALLWLAGTWLVALAVFRRRAVRAGLLGALWFPGTALLAAAIEPGSGLAEGLIVGAGAVLLGLITERLVRWPYAPAVPVAGVFSPPAVYPAPRPPPVWPPLSPPQPARRARLFSGGH